MIAREQRLHQAQHIVETILGEGSNLIQRSPERSEQAGVMFRGLPQSISLDDGGAFLYAVIHMPTWKLYWGISWAMAPGHSRDGATFLDDQYVGSPSGSSYRELLESEPAHDFLMLILVKFETPAGYRDWDEADKRKWLKENVGASERYCIKRSRQAFGEYESGGLTLNNGDGGIAGGGFKSGDANPMKRPEVKAKFLGDNHPMKRPEVRAKFLGENNPSFGKLGALHPTSRKVIELVSGQVYGAVKEASRETGVVRRSIGANAMANVRKLKDGKELTASFQRPSRGKSNSNLGKCWLYYDVFLAEINAGNSVEVHNPVAP